jgi:hypothetical protein
MTVWGAGFQPLEKVRITIGGDRVWTVQCDQIGSFGGHSPVGNAYFALPDIPPGSYVVTATGSQGTLRHARVQVLARNMTMHARPER